ncbi:MAG: LPP20 family lipoprotein [Spirochaetes bacterium]|nr:LPP20 family lipoprotein [Spirochaetota bacterium]
MARRTLIGTLAILFIVSAAGLAAQDTWYNSLGATTNYDSNRYLTGFGISSETGNSAESLENAKKTALADLASKIKVKVDSKARMTTSDFGKENFSSYQSDISSTVNIDLSGIEKYETQYDQKAKRWMALCVLDKSKMRQSLSIVRQENVAKLESLLAEARDWAGKNQLDLLSRTLDNMGVALTELSINLSVDAVLGTPGEIDGILGEYYRKQDEVKALVRSKEILTDADLVADILGAFDWTPWQGAKIAVLPALYKTTEITGAFFFSLKGKLEDALALSADKLVPSSQTEPDLVLVLKGSYYESKDGWRLVYKLNDLTGKKLIGSHDVDLGPRFVKTQKLAFVPPNLQFAAADHDRFVAVIDQPTATDFRAWTEKGSEGVVYTKGEIARFYIQSNRPGYVSLIYHLAGDQRLRVPLIQNWRIDPSQLMQPIKIDMDFEVTPPFGSETAQFFFSPDLIPQYMVKQALIDGTSYDVLAEDYDQFLVRTRGLKAKSTTTNASSLQAECSLSITTMDKLK